MRAAIALVVALALLTSAAETVAAAPKRSEARGCPAEIGPRGAAELTGECRRVVAVPGACRAERSCEALRAEIRQGCEEAGADAPSFCELHVDPDDEEDE